MQESMLQELQSAGSETLRNARDFLAHANAVLSPENRQAISKTLANLEATTGNAREATASLRQVLTPENIALITPGMDLGEVRRRLGRPAKVTPYALSGETHHDWRFLEPPTTPLVFSVITTDGRSVARTMTTPDMDAPENGRGR